MGSFKGLAQARWIDIGIVCMTAMIGIAALAGAMQGWLFGRTHRYERWLLVAAGLALVYPKAMLDYIGMGLLALVIVSQLTRRTLRRRVETVRR
jgi:TRAP-type uncharacterized transport system fused permease subunit